MEAHRDENLSSTAGIADNELHESLGDAYRNTMDVLCQWKVFVCNAKIQTELCRIKLYDGFKDKVVKFDEMKHKLHDNFNLLLVRRQLVQQNRTRPGGILNDADGNIIREDDIVGSSIVKNFTSADKDLTPFVGIEGGFHYYYGHLLPALMVNKLVHSISSFEGNKVVTEVLCHGTDISLPFERDAGKMVENIFSSDAFKASMENIKLGFPAGKNTRRVCVWLVVPAHVFMVVWEVIDGCEFSTCFAVDNLPDNEFRIPVVEAFVAKLSSSGFPAQKANELQCGSLKGVDDLAIQVDCDMACVSFMVRSTVYLSMINDVQHADLAGEFSSAAGILFERTCYDCFERHFLEFVGEKTDEGHVVWFSPMAGKFVNIDDIYVKIINTREPFDLDQPANHFRYYGNKHGFRADGFHFKLSSGCVIAARVCECQEIIERMMVQCRKHTSEEISSN